MAFSPKPLLLMTFLMATTSHLFSHVQEAKDPWSIDRIAKDLALQTFDARRKTAVLYDVPMPSSLSSVSANAVRYRTGSIWRYGAKVMEFWIQPGVVLRPHTKRVILIHQNLGDLSSAYSNHVTVSGYQFITPVLGLLIYNAARKNIASRNQSVFEISVTEKPIRIDFSGVLQDAQAPESEALCVLFDLDGKVVLSKQRARNVCAAWRQGHFALVIPRSNTNTVNSFDDKRLSEWKIVAVSAATAVFAAVLLVLVVIAFVSVRRRRSRMTEMERRAYEDEALQVAMVDHVRAPRATVARTAPVLEDDYRPTP